MQLNGNYTEKNYWLNNLVFQEELFMSISAPTANFRSFQVVINENTKLRTLQDSWQL